LQTIALAHKEIHSPKNLAGGSSAYQAHIAFAAGANSFFVVESGSLGGDVTDRRTIVFAISSGPRVGR
jgi:hypothetical protein